MKLATRTLTLGCSPCTSLTFWRADGVNFACDDESRELFPVPYDVSQVEVSLHDTPGTRRVAVTDEIVYLEFNGRPMPTLLPLIQWLRSHLIRHHTIFIEVRYDA